MKSTCLISLGLLSSLLVAACGGAAETNDPAPAPTATTTEAPPPSASTPTAPPPPSTCDAAGYIADPSRWQRAGTNPKAYEMTTDPSRAFCEKPGAHVESLEGAAKDKFGTFMDHISAEPYRGKRIRLRGIVETNAVMGWSGLWMRVDDAESKVLAFDNMGKRALRGTLAPAEHAVVLDVANEAKDIAFGILLSGAGEVWTKQVVIEVVNSDLPTTG